MQPNMMQDLPTPIYTLTNSILLHAPNQTAGVPYQYELDLA